jgi:hypothetical protein
VRTEKVASAVDREDTAPGTGERGEKREREPKKKSNAGMMRARKAEKKGRRRRKVERKEEREGKEENGRDNVGKKRRRSLGKSKMLSDEKMENENEVKDGNAKIC